MGSSSSAASWQGERCGTEFVERACGAKTEDQSHDEEALARSREMPLTHGVVVPKMRSKRGRCVNFAPKGSEARRAEARADSCGGNDSRMLEKAFKKPGASYAPMQIGARCSLCAAGAKSLEGTQGPFKDKGKTK